MKILHVLTAPRAEGTPRLVLDWLTLTDHEQEILFLKSEGNLKEKFIATGVWQYYNDSFELGSGTMALLIRLVRRICRQRKPDLVIVWPFGLSHWITLGARSVGIRRILAHCGNPPGDGVRKRYLYTYLCVYMGLIFGNRIVACSNYVRDQYKSILPTGAMNFSVVYNALLVERFLPPEKLSRGRTDVTMIGYMEKARDHETLLKAWQLIGTNLNGATLNIIGDGKLRAGLETTAKTMGLTNVNFTGRIDRVEPFLWRSRVYAFCTIREGFGTTLLEALVAGCSVVATDVPACREVLQNGKYGTLVPARNPKELSDAIVKTWTAPLDHSGVAERIRYASSFTPKVMMQGYLEVAGLTSTK